LSYSRTDSHYITDSEFNYIKDNLTNYQKCLNVNMEIAYPEASKRYGDNFQGCRTICSGTNETNGKHRVFDSGETNRLEIII